MQEHLSLIFINLNKYGFIPVSRIVFWKRFSCVLGVQDATTIRVKLYSSIAFLILVNPGSEHEYKLSSEYSTSGSVLAKFASALQSKTPPIFKPQ